MFYYNQNSNNNIITEYAIRESNDGEQILCEDPEKDDYTKWLKKLCFALLVSKNTSKEKIIKQIKLKDCFDERFVDDFIDEMSEEAEKEEERKRIIKELPLLKDYPIDLLADGIYDDKEKAVFKWEKKTIVKLLSNFDDEQRKHGKITTSPAEYCHFFDTKIRPYKDWFFSEIYWRCEPDKLVKYWAVPKNKNMPHTNDNLEIALDSVIGSDYLDVNVDFSRFSHLLNTVN